MMSGFSMHVMIRVRPSPWVWHCPVLPGAAALAATREGRLGVDFTTAVSAGGPRQQGRGHSSRTQLYACLASMASFSALTVG